MENQSNNEVLEKKIVLLETEIKHLRNDLNLTRTEYENSMNSYLDIVSNMEKKILERTKDLGKLHETIEAKSRELQLMLDSSPEMIFYIDRVQKYVRVNNQFAKTVGMRAQEIVGKTHDELFGSDAECFISDIAMVIQTGKPVLNKKNILKTPEGQLSIAIDKIPNKDINENVTGVFGFAKDMTEFEKSENEKMELKKRIVRAEKLKAIGTLAGGIAHDFNNILGAILGYAQLAQLTASENEKVVGYVDQILVACDRAKDLIQQILAFSRQSKSEKMPINIAVIIKEVSSVRLGFCM
ncbi:MAG: PAS domain-containing protein [Deltaproteobacteria bacterium]|nr:PAS domain-containing protein [Deltaproteobacteria bacterium]